MSEPVSPRRIVIDIRPKKKKLQSYHSHYKEFQKPYPVTKVLFLFILAPRAPSGTPGVFLSLSRLWWSPLSAVHYLLPSQQLAEPSFHVAPLYVQAPISSSSEPAFLCMVFGSESPAPLRLSLSRCIPYAS